MITRETKIGLLVGLAFVLVVGILLSEHVTTVQDKPTAALQASGDTVRRAVEAPMPAPPSNPDVVVEQNPQPRVVVATRDQLDKPARAGDGLARAEVDVGSSRDGVPQDPRVITLQRDAQQDGSLPQPRPIGEPENVQLAGGLVEAAKQIGEELVPLSAKYDTKPAQPEAPKPQTADSRTPMTSTPTREYVAQAGDTLNKLAGRFLGGNTPANRAAIVALNPQLQKQPDKVIVGQKYLIPVRETNTIPGATNAPTTKPSADAPKTTDEKKPAEGKPVTGKPAAGEGKFRTYVVKPGDSLWKIAKNELGDAGKIDLIKQLNADVLGESETVKVDMKLKLPG
jgi:nucleoid-associated protein YgaU